MLSRLDNLLKNAEITFPGEMLKNIFGEHFLNAY